MVRCRPACGPQPFGGRRPGTPVVCSKETGVSHQRCITSCCTACGTRGRHKRGGIMIHWLRILVALGCLAVGAIAAQAQTYPSKPITIIVPAVPGGVTDALGRILA